MIKANFPTTTAFTDNIATAPIKTVATGRTLETKVTNKPPIFFILARPSSKVLATLLESTEGNCIFKIRSDIKWEVFNINTSRSFKGEVKLINWLWWLSSNEADEFL